MSRWPWFLVSLFIAAVAFGCGWLVPAHIRAVNVQVIEAAGRGTPTLVERGIVLVRERNSSAAKLLLDAAEAKAIPGRERIQVGLLTLGNEKLSPPLAGIPATESAGSPLSLTESMVRSGNREKGLAALRESKRPAVQELLRTRALTNTVIVPPSGSSAGQAFDTAVCIAGLLLEAGAITDRLGDQLVASARAANAGAGSEPFENVLLDLISLGQRFDWRQLLAVIQNVADLETLHRLAELARVHADELPVVFAAVSVSGEPRAMADYAGNFSQTALADIGDCLPYGAGGLNELFRSGKQLQRANAGDAIATRVLPESVCAALAGFGWRQPTVALVSKWLLYLIAGLFLAQALYVAWPAASDLEWPRRIRGFHWARNLLFALGFLLVVLLVSEPFLAAESQRVEFPFRVHLSTGDGALPAESTGATPSTAMNKLSLLTLLLFFVLQLLIYVTCLLKLSEIRRQNLAPRVKLRLLENEDHLFDAGLYLGFVGTIISLILVSLGVIKPSLMAAYSSTSFGILFVSFFKIFNLRPYRRKLLLEVEAGPQPEMKSAPVHPLAAPL